MPLAKLCVLLGLWGGGEAFSSGAPDSVCEADMRPRHGFAPQVGSRRGNQFKDGDFKDVGGYR